MAGRSASNDDLSHFATGKLEGDLVHGGPADVRKERPVRTVPDSASAVIAEAHVHADVSLHPIHGTGNDIEKMIGRFGVAGKAGLVELDKIDTDRDQGLELGVDDWNQGLGQGVAVGVNVASVNASRQRERPGNRHLYGPEGILPQAVILGHGTQPIGSRQRLEAAIPLTLIVCGWPPVAGTPKSLQTAQVLVKAQIEIDPLHLTIGDAIQARAELVVNGQADRVTNGLFAVNRAEMLGMRGDVADESLVPSRK